MDFLFRSLDFCFIGHASQQKYITDFVIIYVICYYFVISDTIYLL